MDWYAGEVMCKIVRFGMVGYLLYIEFIANGSDDFSEHCTLKYFEMVQCDLFNYYLER